MSLASVGLFGCATSSPSGTRSPSGPVAAADTTDTAAAASPVVPRTVATGPSARQAGAARLDTVEAGRFDQGRMWTFEDPPLDYFEETYDFSPDEDWFRRARLGALRLPNCTASFISPRGLMLTNHHCGREFAAQTARDGENILQNGFYAETLGEERPVDGFYADQLIAIRDVTARVEAALEGAQTDAERAEARRQVFDQISSERKEAAGGGDEIRVQVVSLYNGGRYSAYTFHRYDDLRLVMIPEVDVGYFGGDPDNFTYPRYVLDMSLFRVYGEDGAPLQPDVFFPLDPEGSEAGEGVFVVGNPGSTSRLETVSQLEFRRDVSDRALLAFLESRLAGVEDYVDAQPAGEVSSEVENQVFGLKNAIKLYRGRLRALRDPYILARRRDAEENFREAIRQEAGAREEYGGLIDEMAQIQQEKRDLADAYRAFLLITNPSFSSATMRRALAAYRYLRRRTAGAPEEQLADLREQLTGVADQPAPVDQRFLASRLREVQENLADSTAQAVLAGRTPSAAARDIAQSSALRTAASTQEALDAGTLSMEDPAVEAVSGFYPRFQDYQSAFQGLSARQQEAARQLGRARYAVYGTDVPPDATFSLRISDGRVKGYEYNGTVAPPYTTFFGMYNHYYAYGDGTPWDLPQRWLDRQSALDLSTPLDLVSTNDITGGNSGSPLLNEDLELVGLIFDGNIESLSGDFIYLPQRVRAVSVDVRAILESLGSVYEADRIVEELRQSETAGASR